MAQGALRFHFDHKKATEAVAYLLERAGDKGITKGHLVKMLYAADRRQLRRTGKPITGDRPMAMEHGPILSRTLNLLNGKMDDAVWAAHISKAKPDTHLVHLIKSTGYDHLSENEKLSLTKVFDFFKDMSWAEIEEFCHRNFKEWSNPGKTSQPIHFEEMLLASGKSQDFIDELRAQQREAEILQAILAG